MDFQRPKISVPLEKELLVYQIRDKIHLLTREELETYLVECASLLTTLSIQTHSLLAYIEELEGKLGEVQE